MARSTHQQAGSARKYCQTVVGRAASAQIAAVAEGTSGRRWSASAAAVAVHWSAAIAEAASFAWAAGRHCSEPIVATVEVIGSKFTQIAAVEDWAARC